jgi:hypothetical protein
MPTPIPVPEKFEDISRTELVDLVGELADHFSRSVNQLQKSVEMLANQTIENGRLLRALSDIRVAAGGTNMTHAQLVQCIQTLRANAMHQTEQAGSTH